MPNGVRAVPLWLAFVTKQMFGLVPHGVRAVPLWLALVNKQMFGLVPTGVRTVPLWLAFVIKTNVWFGAKWCANCPSLVCLR